MDNITLLENAFDFSTFIEDFNPTFLESVRSFYDKKDKLSSKQKVACCKIVLKGIACARSSSECMYESDELDDIMHEIKDLKESLED